MSGHTTKAELTGSVGRTPAYRQTAIDFEQPPLYRREDPLTSRMAGEKHRGGKSEALRLEILDELSRRAMTAKELEVLPRWSRYCTNSIRKRLSELDQTGRVIRIGIRGGCSIYSLPLS